MVRGTHSFNGVFYKSREFFLVALRFSLKFQIGVVLKLYAVVPGVLSVTQGGRGSWAEMEPRYLGSWDQALAFCLEGALPSVSCCTKM